MGSNMTTKWTNGRQEQEFRTALKRGGLADLGKIERKNVCYGQATDVYGREVKWVAGMLWWMEQR
jgi:hypothetical protein